jgi:hypothetical protein
MKPLKLPPTIRTARPDEVPQRAEVLDKIELRQKANIVEGFVLYQNETHELPFKFFAEINIDNDRLWDLFAALLLQLPEEVCLVFNQKDDEPAYSGYADKYAVYNQLATCKTEIMSDGLLEVGALYNDEAFMEEVFVKSPKYIQYWGMEEARFRKTMAEFNIFEVPSLNFIDEYPMVTEALRLHFPGAIETEDLLKYFQAIVSASE